MTLLSRSNDAHSLVLSVDCTVNTRLKLLFSGATTKQLKSNFAQTPALLKMMHYDRLSVDHMTDLDKTFSCWLQLRSARYKALWLLIDRNNNFLSKPW